MPYVYENTTKDKRPTRGFLTVSGTLAEEHVTVVVCHWPVVEQVHIFAN